ncbi:Na(+)/H(+) antiporter 1 [uncultured archaeon]|nr:Na(+)/H(+) antiporter 1 [uncultured archaeon]
MYEIFLAISIILFAGFGANLIFERTRVSSVLILMGLGFVLGPGLKLVDSGAGSALAGLAPVIGALALIIMLFDGGISLPIFQVIRSIPKAVSFTVLTFVLTLLATALLAWGLMGWDILSGLLLGAVLGGSSSAIVIAMVEKSKVRDETRHVLTLESTLTDALCIISAIVLIRLISAGVPIEPVAVAGLLASAFSVAIVVGLLGAVAWLFILRRLAQKNVSYMLTLAAVILLYALVEAAGGNGGIAVFSFGLVLGNAKRISSALKMKDSYSIDKKIADFQTEVTFFTRTFFFVYLGMIMDLGGLTWPLVAFAFAMVAVFYLCRRIGIALTLPSTNDASFIAWMMPRGLAAAVLAGLPAASGIYLHGFVELAFLTIILTNIMAMAGQFVGPVRKKSQAPVLVNSA